MVQVRIDQELDLRGEVCPYTFVKTKLALESMDSGQVLRVVVDHLPAVENVPRSVTNEGHEVLRVGRISETDWELLIRKGEQT